MNIKKSIVIYALALILLNGCHKKEKHAEIINDCSGVFETRYVGSEKGVAAAKDKMSSDRQNKAYEADQNIITQCKILEVKIDDDNKCEVVGSDKIDNLTRSLEENKDEKIILITPEKQLHELDKMASKYMNKTGIDISKYFDTEIFKSLNFPYKGLRCNIGDKKFVIWLGDKRVVLTVNKL